MTAKKNGTAAAVEGEPRELPRQVSMRVGDIIPRPGLNTRLRFDKVELQELANSIRLNGLLQPLVLHETDEPVKHLVAGERRWRACKLLGDDFEVNCTIKRYTEAELVIMMITENFQRVDLTPVEEARAFEQALALPGMTQAKLAEVIGGGKKSKRASQPYISNRVRLLQLPPEILGLVDDGRLQPTVARDVLLPFMAVPEQYRTPFFAELVSELSVPSDDPYADDAEDVIRSVVRDRSRSLSPNGYGNDTPVFGPKRHEKGCDCGAPELFEEYSYNGNKKVGRCWNIEWWNAEQKRAKADKKKREQRTPKVTSDESIAGVPLMEGDAFHRKFGYNYGQAADAKFTNVADERGHFARDGVFDPAVLDRSALIVVKSRWNDGHELVSTDVQGVQQARDAYTAAVEERVRSERPKRAAADLETVRSAATADWRDPVIVIRTVLSLPQHEANVLNVLARELGFKPKGDVWTSGALQGLSAEQMMDTLHVAVLRCQQLGAGRVWLVADMIEQEMAEPLRAALLELVPWELGAPADPDDTAGDDEEAAEDVPAGAVA